MLAEVTATLGLIQVLFIFLEYTRYGYQYTSDWELQFEHTFIKKDIIFIHTSFLLQAQGSDFLLISLFKKKKKKSA